MSFTWLVIITVAAAFLLANAFTLLFTLFFRDVIPLKLWRKTAVHSVYLSLAILALILAYMALF